MFITVYFLLIYDVFLVRSAWRSETSSPKHSDADATEPFGYQWLGVHSSAHGDSWIKQRIPYLSIYIYSNWKWLNISANGNKLTSLGDRTNTKGSGVLASGCRWACTWQPSKILMIRQLSHECVARHGEARCPAMAKRYEEEGPPLMKKGKKRPFACRSPQSASAPAMSSGVWRAWSWSQLKCFVLENGAMQPKLSPRQNKPWLIFSLKVNNAN